MISEYIKKALRRAQYEKLDDGSFIADVAGLPGVLANAPKLEECRDQLAEVVEEWVLVRVARGIEVPALDGISISVTSGV